VQVARERAREQLEVPALEPAERTSETAPADSAVETPVAAPPTDRGPGSGVQRTAGFVVGGLGLVGLGLGTVFLLQRNGKADESNGICPSNVGCAPGSQERVDTLNDDARSAQTLSMIGFIGGGVALATGAVLILTAPKAAPPSHATLRVVPVMGPGGAGVFAAGRF
jgi:hypothetical protein